MHLLPETLSRADFLREVHNLLDECPLEIGELREKWYADEKPQTASERFLVEECYRGNLQAIRYHRAHDRALVEQQEHLIETWDKAFDKAVADLKNELLNGPDADFAGIIDSLKQFGRGLTYLQAAWTRLGEAANTLGFWTRDNMAMAGRLLGAGPGPEAVAEHEDVYLLFILNQQCQPVVSEYYLESLLEPASRPPGPCECCVSELLPSTREDSRGDALQKWVADELATCCSRLAEERRIDVDRPNLSNITTAGAIIVDPATAKRLQRAASEYRSTYYRAHNALMALRKAPGRGAEKGDSPEHGQEGWARIGQERRSCGGQRWLRRARPSSSPRPSLPRRRRNPSRSASRTRHTHPRVGSSPNRPLSWSNPRSTPCQCVPQGADIGVRVSVSSIIPEASIDASIETESIITKQVKVPIGEIRPEPQKEPGFGNGARLQTSHSEGRKAPGGGPETRDPESKNAWGMEPSHPRAESALARAPGSVARAAATTQVPAPAETTDHRPTTPEAISASEELRRARNAYHFNFQDIEDPNVRADYAARFGLWDCSPTVHDEGPADEEEFRAPPPAGP